MPLAAQPLSSLAAASAANSQCRSLRSRSRRLPQPQPLTVNAARCATALASLAAASAANSQCRSLRNRSRRLPQLQPLTVNEQSRPACCQSIDCFCYVLVMLVLPHSFAVRLSSRPHCTSLRTTVHPLSRRLQQLPLPTVNSQWTVNAARCAAALASLAAASAANSQCRSLRSRSRVACRSLQPLTVNAAR